MRSDRELIAAIIARDETACQELYEVYGEELRQHLARTVRDAVAADDLLQELLLRVWNCAEQWRSDAQLKMPCAARSHNRRLLRAGAGAPGTAAGHGLSARGR